MRLPTNLKGFRSSKLIKFVAGGSALAVSSVAVAQAVDGGSSPDVDAVKLRADNRVDDGRKVLVDIEGNTVSVPAETLLADSVDNTNDSPDNTDSPDDSPVSAPAPASNDSPDDTDSPDDSPDDS
jgi:hypothetical protein